MRFSLILALAGGLMLAGCAGTESTGQAGGGTMPASQTTTQGGAGGGGMGPGTQLGDLGRSVPDRVLFGTDQTDLSPEGQQILTAQARILAANPQVGVTIEGHADERGTREYNLALGEKRANSAKSFLVALGISPNRIRTVSFGKERPVNPTPTEAGWAENRRAVTVVGQ